MSDFLEVTGLSGPSLANGFRGAFDITGFNFTIDAPTGVGAGSGLSLGSPDFSPITVSFSDESGLTSFLSSLTLGGPLSHVSLIETRPTGQEALRVNLTNAFVTGIDHTADGYTLSLDYQAIGLITPASLPNGTPDTFGYSRATESLTSPPPNASPGGLVAPHVEPTKFYLLIDGLTGESKDPGHQGWFEVDAFDAKTLVALADAGGTGLGSAPPRAEPLELTLSNGAAIADLLRLIARGQLIDGARLEGVTGTGGSTPAVTYDLNLAKVAITDIVQDDSNQARISLAYGAFQLTTDGVGPTGAASGHPTTVSWDYLNNSKNVNLPSIAAGHGEAGAVAPTDFYLDTVAIHGSASDLQHTGALQVSGFSFGASANVDLRSAGGVGASKPDFGELTVHFADKAGLADFLADLTIGRNIGRVSLVGAQVDGAGGHKTDTYVVTLDHASVTSMVDNEGDGYSVTLAYGQIGVTTKPMQADGSFGAPVSFGYDLMTASQITPPATVAPPGAAVHAAAVDKYYLLVDGVNGGSTDAGHVGWFELMGHDVEAVMRAAVGGIGGAGRPSASLDLDLAASTGVTQLLAKLAVGGSIAGARIEGVSLDGGPPKAVYDLDLVDVNVSHLSQNAGGGADLSLAFRGLSLTTTNFSTTGAPVTSAPVMWDFADGRPLVTVPTIGPAGSGGATQPTEFLFAASGVRGDAQDAGFAGSFHITGFQFEAGAQVAVAGGGSVSPAQFGPLTVSFANETGLATFLKDLTTGTRVDQASLVGLRTSPGGAAQEVYRINLADAHVTDVHQTTDGGYSVSFVYDQIGMTTRYQAQNGSLQAQQFGFDIADRIVIPPPPNAIPAGGVASTQPATFYLLVDGVNGGSTDVGHVGWFKISGFDLDNAVQLGTGGGLNSGMARTDGITVSLGATPGLTDLLSHLASADAFAGARIEGVTADGHPTVVYGLDLVNVGVSHLELGSDGDYQLGFAFEAFKLTTSRVSGPGQITSWDYAAHSSNVDVPPIAPGDGAQPPAAPAGLSLDTTSDSGALGDRITNAHTAKIDGAAQAGMTVKVLEGGNVLGTAVADASGHFQISVTLTDGVHNLTATATDPSGATSPASSALTLTVDSVAPDAPSALALDSASDTGTAGDGRTSARQLTIDGHAEAGSTVTLYDGQTAVGTAVADGSGSFQITTSPLDNGAHALTAKAADVAGNLSAASAGLSVTVQSVTLAPDAGAHTLAEQPGVTGAATPDAASATLAFTDADLAATHAVQLAAPTAAWSGGADVPAAVLSALAAGLVSATLTDGPGGGSVAVVLRAPDSLFDFLSPGETLTITASVSVAGSTGGQDAQPVTFVVTGANDGPVVSAVLGGHSLNEIAGVSGSAAPDVTSTVLSFTDADLTDHHTVSVAGAPSVVWSGGATVPPTLAGAFSGAVTASLSEAAGSGLVTATFSAPDTAFDFLGQGETLTLTYDVTVTDSHGATVTQPLSFVVTGTNDAPVFQADHNTHNVVAGQATTDSMTSILTFTDPDWQDHHTAVVGAPQFVWSAGGAVPADLASKLGGALTVDVDPSGPPLHVLVMNFTAPDSAFGFLAQGETLTISYPVTVDDGHGGTASQPFTITVIGTNSAPALAADAGPHTLAEQAGTTGATAPDVATATLAFTDANLSDHHTLSVAAPSLLWSGGAILPAGLAASLGGALTTSLTESAGGGSVAASFAAADKTFDFLAAGESLTLTYAVTVTDNHGSSATQPVTFVVIGANDAPVVAAGAVATATVSEQAGALGAAALDQASGAVVFHDPDLNDRPSVAVAGQGVVAHAAGGASFALTPDQVAAFEAAFHFAPPGAAANDVTVNWTYEVADKALDFLGAGESVTVTTVFQVDDHHGGTLTQPVVVTLQGTNDAATALADAAAVARNGSLAVDRAHGVLANDRDPDLHDTLQVFAVNGQAGGVGAAVAGAYGSLTLKADGSYSYVAAKNAALPASGVGQDSFTYQVSDGHGGVASQTLTVTVYATNGVDYLTADPSVVRLSGGNGKDVLDAGVGSHLLDGGNGADALVAGFGADTMTGGNGPDIFVFGHPGFGQAVITDFANSDGLQFDHHLFTSVADVLSHAAQVGRDVVITLNTTDSITLQGVSLATLRSADILLA